MKIRKDKKKRSKPLLEPVEANEGNSRLARALGSTDGDTREKGLQFLTLWLQSNDNVDEKDILRLWKALYYCFWHSDQVRVQTALADRLSGLLSILPEATAFAFFEGFVRTMKREWFGIDQHRINKFMMLVRKFYAKSLEMAAEHDWDKVVVRKFSNVWTREVILNQENGLGHGLAYHYASLAVDELKACVESTNVAPKHKCIMAILDPFIQGIEKSTNRVLVKRIHSDVFGACATLVETNGKALSELKADQLSAMLFELGASKETKTLNREYLYLSSSAIEQAALAKQKKMKTKRTRGDVDVVLDKVSPEPEQIDVPLKKKKVKKVKKEKEARVEDTNGIHIAKPHHARDANGQLESSPQHTGEDEKRKPESRRKSVRFSLRSNLVRTIGEPPYPQEIRTPPHSKPKGSALKNATSGSTAAPLSQNHKSKSPKKSLKFERQPTRKLKGKK